MDELILMFSKEQLKKYNEIKNSESVALDFDTELPELDEISQYSFDEFISAVETEVKKLLAFKKFDSMFSVSISQAEIKALVPVYYDTILGIERHVKELSSNTRALAMNISQVDKMHASLCAKYADFLPYKAALYNRDDYERAIAELDDSFNQSIQLVQSYLDTSYERLKKVETIHGIIQDFYQKASEASDSPKFKNFNARAFFYAIEAFIEQLKAIK